jgi:hypothetical protein
MKNATLTRSSPKKRLPLEGWLDVTLFIRSQMQYEAASDDHFDFTELYSQLYLASIYKLDITAEGKAHGGGRGRRE